MSDKKKFPVAMARAVAEKIVEVMRPVCARIEIAGSIRREKAAVGDIEIVYIPKWKKARNPEALFADEMIEVNAADEVIAQLIAEGKLEKRKNKLGSETWGDMNKLAKAVKTGIPVDLFSTCEGSWWNYLVCRTGSAEMNTRIAMAAIEKGYRWNPTNSGFQRKWGGDTHAQYVVINSEREVFEFAGIPYLEPRER